MVLAHRVRKLELVAKFSSLSFSPLDLTSTFTVTFYMTRFYIWKNKRRFIVSSFCPCPRSFKSEISTAFTITMYEYEATIPSLWKHVMGLFFLLEDDIILILIFKISDFAHDHPEYIAENNSLGFMSSDNGKTYNLCHCWYPIRFNPRNL